MSVYKRPGQPAYSYDFYHRGRRFSGSTGCTTKREAEQHEEKVRRQVSSERVDAADPMAFEAACARYWDEVGQFHKRDGETLRHLDWLQTQIGRKTMLSTIGDSDMARLVAKRRGEGVGPASVNRSVCEPMRAILRRAGKTWKQNVQDIDWKQHFLKEPQERIREASAEEEKKLISGIRGDYAPALRFALLSGCRRAEIVGLTWPAVDFFNKIITVRGKGDRSRVIPMTTAMYELLKGEHGRDPLHVFTYVAKRPVKDKGKRRPITMEGFKTEWRRTKKRTRIGDYRFHDNRHTAATRLVRATGNLKLAQKLLGHSDIKTTSRYSHVTNDDLRAGMEAAIPTEIPTGEGEAVEKSSENKAKEV